MSPLSNIQMAQAGFANRTTEPHPEKYHPGCGDEHRHKPTKALIGITLLIVLSVLLYGITGHASEPTLAPQHTVSQAR